MKEFQSFHITCKGLVFYQNRFLLHHANDPEFFGALECPGGRVNKGEIIEDVLVREIKEETGLDLVSIEHEKRLFDLNQRDAIEYGWDKNTQIIEIYYMISIPDHILLSLQKLDEVSSFEWIDEHTDLDNFSYRVESRKKIYKKAQELLLTGH